MTFLQTVGIFVVIPGAVLVGITAMVYGGRWAELWKQRKAGVRPTDPKPRTEPVLGRPADAAEGEGPIVHGAQPVSTRTKPAKSKQPSDAKRG